MTPQFIEGVAFDAMKVTLLLSAPCLLVALVVGVIISILQATTQINETTLAQIPKMVAIYITLIVAGGFMMDRIMTYTTGIFGDFTRFIK